MPGHAAKAGVHTRELTYVVLTTRIRPRFLPERVRDVANGIAIKEGNGVREAIIPRDFNDGLNYERRKHVRTALPDPSCRDRVYETRLLQRKDAPARTCR